MEDKAMWYSIHVLAWFCLNAILTLFRAGKQPSMSIITAMIMGAVSTILHHLVMTAIGG